MTSPTVRLDGCEVRGATVSTAGSEVAVYWGIPFARAPLGALRFAAPEPIELPRALSALTPRPSAPQPVSKTGIRLGLAAEVQDEDCLHLNVWTNAKPGDDRPVLVWIHGGGFDVGDATNPVTHPHRLVARTGCVVVGIHYRLGAIGFLSLPGSPANRGLLDQLEALRFVQRHVGAFGGDPRNVTLLGWSAGAVSALLHAVDPKARGLFRRVIAQSGHVECLHTQKEARRVREALFRALGWPAELSPDDARARLATVGVDALVRAQAKADRLLEGMLHGLAFMPTFTPPHPFEHYRMGAARHLEFLIGANRDELKLARLAEVGRSLGEGALRERVSDLLSSARGHDALAREIIASYRAVPHLKDASPNEVWATLASDYYFRYPAWRIARRAAEHSPVYAFDFAFRSRGLGGILGAAHGVEVPLVLGTYDVPAMSLVLGDGARARKASGEVQDAWASFARDGAPRLPGGEPWPRLDDSGRVAVIDDRWSVATDAYRFAREAWGRNWPLVRPLHGSGVFHSSLFPSPAR